MGCLASSVGRVCSSWNQGCEFKPHAEHRVYFKKIHTYVYSSGDNQLGCTIGGPTMSGITELLHVPNPLHNISLGHAGCHQCWWLLAVLPVRLPELECLISKQCLFLPVSPLYVCIRSHVIGGTWGAILELFLCMDLASLGFEDNSESRLEALCCSGCVLRTLLSSLPHRG